MNVSEQKISNGADNQTITPTGCCEPFNPEPWQDKEITWTSKLFVKDRVTSFLHIPLNFGGKVVKNMNLIKSAAPKQSINLCSPMKIPYGARIFILTLSKKFWGQKWLSFPAHFSLKFLKARIRMPANGRKKWKNMSEAGGKN